MTLPNGSAVVGAAVFVTIRHPYENHPDRSIEVIAEETTDQQGEFRARVEKQRLGDPFGERVSVWIH